MPKTSQLKAKKESRKEEGRETFSDAFKVWLTATFQKSEWLGLNYRHQKVSFLNGRAKQKERKGWRGRAEVKHTHVWTVGHRLGHTFCLSNNASVLRVLLSISVFTLAKSVWRLVLQRGETPLAVWQESTNGTAAEGHMDEWSPLSPFQETVHRQLLSWIIITHKRKWCIFLFLCFVAILVSFIVSKRWTYFWQQTKTTCWYEVGRVLHVGNHMNTLYCVSVCTKGVFSWEGREAQISQQISDEKYSIHDIKTCSSTAILS